MTHDSYSDEFLRETLASVKTVAQIGASDNWNRPSYFVAKYLRAKGFRMIPVNPRIAGHHVLGERCYATMADILDPIDMVDVFRPSEAVRGIVDEALALSPLPKVIWMQFGVRDDVAAARAEAGGIRVVMDRCPKVEYARLNGELGWSGLRTNVISSKRRSIPK